MEKRITELNNSTLKIKYTPSTTHNLVDQEKSTRAEFKESLYASLKFNTDGKVQIFTKEIIDIDDIDNVLRNYYRNEQNRKTDRKYEGIERYVEDGTTYMYARGTSNSSGKIGINDYNIDVDNTGQTVINPYRTLIAALNKIRLRKNVSILEEHAMQMLYHEILHKQAKEECVFINSIPSEYYKELAMELVNEFIARHDYPNFIECLGGKAIHQHIVLEQGFGYSKYIYRFRHIIRKTNLLESEMVMKLRPILLKGRYNQIANKLYKIIVEYTELTISQNELWRILFHGEHFEFIRLIRSINV